MDNFPKKFRTAKRWRKIGEEELQGKELDEVNSLNHNGNKNVDTLGRKI